MSPAETLEALERREASARAETLDDVLLTSHGWISREGSNFWSHADVNHSCTREHALNRIRLQSADTLMESDESYEASAALNEQRGKLSTEEARS